LVFVANKAGEDRGTNWNSQRPDKPKSCKGRFRNLPLAINPNKPTPSQSKAKPLTPRTTDELKAGDVIVFRVIKTYAITAGGAAVNFHHHPAKASIAARLAQAHKVSNPQHSCNSY